MSHDQPTQYKYLTLHAVDSQGQRIPISASALEIDLPDQQARISIDLEPHPNFSGRLTLRAELLPMEEDAGKRPVCAVFVVRPGACNVLDVAVDAVQVTHID